MKIIYQFYPQLFIDPGEGTGHFSFHNGGCLGHSEGGIRHFDVTLEVVQDTMIYEQKLPSVAHPH